ncbi:enoyl-CoA hydratase/isomerase family protein [Novosphingobium cyanobacteriorum]|uniref:Enoyl-CoA hydratase-related protein n=1 Tax=Novosphingobium cyanobacteriorum TaxID=3024215 RepID=A0ABT6CL66_9SPHN|nr:enoyl-CoA hydratase-related protein [Novosphingobium cyanobacteriorum]MDF8334587.1 enoyl-CoA hydratase-related protein [Novosphingobium cyanobacteriorum]
MPITLQIEAGVATVTLDRPEKKNALDRPMRIELPRVFEQIQDDVSVRAVVLTGGGTDFCAGADVGEMGGGGIADGMARVEILHRMMRGIIHTDIPIIAAVRGVCVGVGWSMALACDYIVAASDTRFQFAFRHIGLAPDGGAVHLLSRNLGPIRAKALVYSGRFVSGDEAAALGLVSEVVPADEVITRARALAGEWANAATLSLKMSKRQFAAAETQSYEEALAAEMVMQPLMVRSEDFREGTAAFKEKRKAQFRGQ